MNDDNEITVPVQVSAGQYAEITFAFDEDVGDQLSDSAVESAVREEIDFDALAWRFKMHAKHNGEDVESDTTTSDDETGIRSGKGQGWFSRVFL